MKDTVSRLLIFFAIISAGCAVFATSARSSASYKLSSRSSQNIKEWNVAKNVTNNCANPIFVPTKTSAEWSAFISHHPSCVSLSEVSPMLCGDVHSFADCTAIGGTVVSTGSCSICKYQILISVSKAKSGVFKSVPGGWSHYSNWFSTVTTTYSGTDYELCTVNPTGCGGCPYGYCRYCTSGCTVGAWSFGNHSGYPMCQISYQYAPTCSLRYSCSTQYVGGAEYEVGIR